MENRKLTIDDIARELKISKTTVSRAISGKGRISQETRQRVLQFINENNYRPSAIAKGLAQSKTFNIAFTMPGDYGLIDLPFFQKCMWGISTMAAKMDYDVFLCMVSDGDISRLKRLVDNHKVDGVILGRTYAHDVSQIYLKEQGIPFVTIGTSLDDEVLQIDNDHVQACKELTSILLLKGMERVALIGGSTNYNVNMQRLQGFRAGFEAVGKTPDEGLIHTEVGDAVMVESIVQSLVKQEVDCILCMDDSICSMVLSKLAKDRVKIPEEMLVASFYNSSILQSNQPAITSLQFDAMELGMVSCEVLMNAIDKREAVSQKKLGYEVIMKESTAIR